MKLDLVVCNQRGQAILEYALMLALVISAITTMQIYTRRGLQAGIKQAADRLSPCAVDNPACGGLIDSKGEIAQEMGVRNETGDQKFGISLQGQVLESETGVVIVSEPEHNFVRRVELPGGAVSITKNRREVTQGSLPGGGGRVSHTVRVIQDGAGP